MKYKRCGKKIKELRRKLIKRWIEEKQKTVLESKNIMEWWKAMNWYRKNKTRTKNEIKCEEWLRRFRELLGDMDQEERTDD